MASVGKLNFNWLIENEVAGHAEPTGSDDLTWLFKNGIRALVRMSERPKVSPGQIKALGMDDMYESVPDFTAPSQVQLSRIVDFIMKSVWDEKPVGVSCGAGIGRTGTVLACYLAKRTHTGQGLVVEIRRNRPGAVETAEQLKAVDQYLRSIMNDDGEKYSKKVVPGPRITLTDIAAKGNKPPPSVTGANKGLFAEILEKWGIEPKAGAIIPVKDSLNYLKNIAAERNYGRGKDHADIVSTLSLSLYQQMVALDLFPKVDRGELLLESASYLHDFGYPPEEDHNINGFQLLMKRLTAPDTFEILTDSERAIVLYCVLWHRGIDFSIRPPDIQIEPSKLTTAMELASVLRIGDGLSYPGGKPTKKVTVQLQNHTLTIDVCPSRSGDKLRTQVSKANQKKDLLEKVLKGNATPEITKIEVRKCAHSSC
jgi:atypical dual specificity phosphatase